MTIAIRTAISKGRRRYFKDVSIDAHFTDSMKFDPVALADDSAGYEERSAILGKLKELIETCLTQKQRDATHSFLKGVPVEVFAEKTGSNRNAVYKLIHDARVKLRLGFEQAGYGAERVSATFS